MSDPDPPPPPGLASRVLSILMLVIGGVMVLPGIGAGLCILFSFNASPSPFFAFSASELVIGLAIGLAGLALIVWAALRLDS